MGDEGQDSSAELQVLRDEIVKAQSDQARKRELLHRLHVKLNSLKDEVAERGKEVELVKREKETEDRRQNDPKQQSKGKEERRLEARNDLVRTTALKALLQRIPMLAEQQSTEEEDAGGPVASAKEKDDKKEEAQHDTCLVSYVEVKNVLQITQYEATFRIDKETSIHKLHVDTCEYWGSSTKEFILCKIGKEDYDSSGLPTPKNVLVPYDKPPIPIPDQFEKGSLIKILDNKQAAHLYLVESQKVEPWTEQLRADEIKRKKKEAAAVKAVPEEEEGADDKDKVMEQIMASQQAAVEPFVRAFAQWPGIYHLLALRKRDDIQPRIVCREVLVYFLLAVITALIFNLRVANTYHLQQGVRDLMVDGLQDSKLQRFNFREIKTPDHAFMWLRDTFHAEVFNPNSTLQQYYQPVGVLRLRQQKVKLADCARYKVAAEVGIGVHDCLYTEANEKTYTKQSLGVELDGWLVANMTGRISDVMSVRQYQEEVAADAPWPPQQYPLRGKVQNEYGGTGVVVDYLLDRGNLTMTGATFLQDLNVYQKYWITPATRMLLVEMTMVNVHFDRFMSIAMLLEMTPGGRVIPQAMIRAFACGDPTGGEGLAGTMDLLRALLVFYIFLVKGMFEIKWRMNQEHSGLHYVFSVLGFLDAATIANFLTVFWARMNMTDVCPLEYYGKGQTVFRSYYKYAWTFETIFVAEAFFFLLVCIRFASFMRKARAIFVFGKMFKMAMKDYLFFGILLVPMFWGMVFFAHSIWSPYLYGFSTWSEALLSLLIFIKGDLSIKEMNREARIWTGLFMAIFFLVIICFFVNGLVGIVVHAFWSTSLLYGYSRKTHVGWSWNQWKHWMLWGPVFLLLGGTPPEDELAEATGGGDEEDEEMSEGEKEEEGGGEG